MAISSMPRPGRLLTCPEAALTGPAENSWSGTWRRFSSGLPASTRRLPGRAGCPPAERLLVGGRSAEARSPQRCGLLHSRYCVDVSYQPMILAGLARFRRGRASPRLAVASVAEVLQAY